MRGRREVGKRWGGSKEEGGSLKNSVVKRDALGEGGENGGWLKRKERGVELEKKGKGESVLR